MSGVVTQQDVQEIRDALNESARRILLLRDFINARSVTRQLARRHLPDLAWNAHLGEAYRALLRIEALPARPSAAPERSGT